MTLEQLLSLLRNAILNDRSDRTSGPSDYLWEDETLVTYINEAQNRFARHGLVLRDGSTNEVTRVRLVEGQTAYDLHPAVLAVVSARRDDQEVDLLRAGHALFSSYRTPTDDWIDPTSLTALPPGAPLAYSTDEQMVYDDAGTLAAVSLRIYPAPSAAIADEYLRLRVVRKPLDPLTINNLKAVPEIPEDHHLEMLDWAAYLALRIADQDAGMPRRAAEFAQSFEAHVAAARKAAMRKLFAPQPWGMGSNGWSWSN